MKKEVELDNTEPQEKNPVYNETCRSHILNIDIKDFPEKFMPIIRRLGEAAANKEVREAMWMEDYMLRDLRMKENEKKKSIDDCILC